MAVATALVGIAGILGTVWTAREGRKAADRARTDDHGHQERMARETRIQQRRGDTYVEALRVMHMVGEWAQRLRPVIETDPPPPMPPLPSPEEQMRVWALLDANGSTAARQLFEDWHNAANAIRHADFKIGLSQRTRAEHGMSGIDMHEVWGELEDRLRPNEVAARKAFAAQVHRELNVSDAHSPGGSDVETAE